MDLTNQNVCSRDNTSTCFQKKSVENAMKRQKSSSSSAEELNDTIPGQKIPYSPSSLLLVPSQSEQDLNILPSEPEPFFDDTKETVLCGLIERPRINLERIDADKPFRTLLHRMHYLDNVYLKTGYRVMPSCSRQHCISSLFYWHNETINIWSHLFPSICYLLYAVFLLVTQGRYTGVRNTSDLVVDVLFCLCASCCFFNSSLFHSFRCNHVHDYQFFLSCDFAGILLLLLSCNIVLIYFELQCYETTRILLLITVFTLFVLQILLIPYLIKYRKTWLRTFLFVVFAFLGITVYAIKVTFWEYGMYEEYKWVSFKFLCADYGIIMFGLVLRAWKIPEKWFPERFDIIGASHQWFHLIAVGVTIAGYVYYHHLYSLNAFSYACRADYPF